MKALEHENRKVRGIAAQLARRELERSVRMEAVAFGRWVQLQSMGWGGAARRLGLSPATLALWQRGWEETHLHVRARGRPAERTDRETRAAVMALFQLMGPGVGLAVLQEFFPGVARRELEDLQRRYREAHLKKSCVLVHALRWQRVGAVWAMDHTEPPSPIDGTYRSILVVRDLSSGMQLMALPLERASAGATIAALQALFREHGAPLVVKSDNGSAFTAEEVGGFLARRSVLHLLSPPGLPAYNGACEAGIGSLKTRAHHESARNDRAGEWTCDDVEGARLMANETSRPWGVHAPTPRDRWRIRLMLSPKERDRFLGDVDEQRERARREMGYLPGIELGPAAQASVDRRAIARALVAHGILKLRRRRITLPISFAKSSRIS